GGGRCKFSNTVNPRHFVRLFGDKNSPLLGHSLRAFSRDELVEMLSKYGVEGQLEKNYRLYTKSGRGNDVVKALVTEMQNAGGVLVTLARINSIARVSDSIYQLAGKFEERDEIRRARSVVVCTGGLSYPATGSSGDGYGWARNFGHDVTDLRAALVGLSVEEDWARGLQGLAWPDAQATLWTHPEPGKKPLCTERAEILFT